MHTLVTGATGFIGARLAAKCLELGHSVRTLALANNEVEEQREQDLIQAGADVMNGSVTDESAVSNSVRGVDLIFHLAAAQHEANVPDEYFRRVNVDGTRTLLDAAVGSGVRRFVHGSTIGVYGSETTGKLSESSVTRPDNIYGITKFEAEECVLSCSEDVAVTIIRISETYGPGDRRLLKLFRGLKKGVFVNIGPGLNRHQLIYVDDLVDGLLAAAFHGKINREIFLLVGPDVLTTNQMIDAIAKALAVAPPRIRLPLPPLQAAAWLLETTLSPIGIQPPLHRRRLDFFTKSFSFDTTKAWEQLGFKSATSFFEGAKKTADWYAGKGLL